MAAPAYISVPLRGIPISGAGHYFDRRSPAQELQSDSELLKSIRSALRSSGTDNESQLHSSLSLWEGDPAMEEELSWDANTVILSAGGVLRKKWNFTEEGQRVQYACIGFVEQPYSHWAPANSTPTQSHQRTEPSLYKSSDTSERPTFGSFHRAKQELKHKPEFRSVVRCVYVFLRSIGKICLLDGLDYTFSLPITVRHAWPLYPHGVMLQRVLEASEIEEAETLEEEVLPSIFSFTSPFSEPAPVGVTNGLVGGFTSAPPMLKDEDENCRRSLNWIPATEHVVWVSSHGQQAPDDIVVTLDKAEHRLSVWRYGYIKPKDTPVPLMPAASPDSGQKAMPPWDLVSPAAVPTPQNPLTSLPSMPGSPHQTRSRTHSPDAQPLPAVPGMPASLSTSGTISGIGASKSSSRMSPSAEPHRRGSFGRHDLSINMDRSVTGGRYDADVSLPSIEHGRMRASYWMEKLFSQTIPEADSVSWKLMTAAIFDHRFDGNMLRSLLAICFPTTGTLAVLALSREDDQLKAAPYYQTDALSVAPLLATRKNVVDLAIVKTNGTLSLLTHGVKELPLMLISPDIDPTVIDPCNAYAWGATGSLYGVYGNTLIAVQYPILSSLTLVFSNLFCVRVTIDLCPRDYLTSQCLRVLALSVPSDLSFSIHRTFLELWSSRGLSTADGIEYDCFVGSICSVLGLSKEHSPTSATSTWESLGDSPFYTCVSEDAGLRHLRLPPRQTVRAHLKYSGRHRLMLAPILNALHFLASDLQMMTHRHDSLLRLVPLICDIASIVRPEWADYWKRLCPEAIDGWPSPDPSWSKYVDERLSAWPWDITTILYNRLNNSEWLLPWRDTINRARQFSIAPSCEYGQEEPLEVLCHVNSLYCLLSDKRVTDTRRRAEHAISSLAQIPNYSDYLRHLPLGIASPLKEAARTCQLFPPADWPYYAYRLIGRPDLAEGTSSPSDSSLKSGYRTVKQFLDPDLPRPSVQSLAHRAAVAGRGELNFVSGVELNIDDFNKIRFGQDKRLDEVARMLCSSIIPTVRLVERPDMNEYDQAKEQQQQVIRIAEKTLALSYGRAMFTIGSIDTVKREAYTIPKIEYSIRLLPQNVTLTPEPGKIPPDWTSWAEFHNGVAAGLRISSSSSAVDSSWIAFNKPAELSPEHAGFLFGLGLTGHLKEMLTWHTFSYLTPKHDLTSIAVLLGLSAANAGTGNRHVTKLLAVHTPALLPTPSVDLNVPLITQTAGLAGTGLLYMGTKDRHMAEVCLREISRKDLAQPDISNDHREAYTLAAAIAFGMVMLGKGSSVPADIALLSRLRVLIHGESQAQLHIRAQRPTFDTNLTSPAATIALGLMYFRTNRKDITDILVLPDTILELNDIQPGLLLLRTLARALIMWDDINCSNDWIDSQMPPSIIRAMRDHHSEQKEVDDAIELAYYNMVAGCCFAMALKFAGTASVEAYMVVIGHWDIFSRLAYMNGPAYDHRIKRAALRDGLNLISISLSMIMAGTGELTCLKRFRYAYGMPHSPIRYGNHVATHQSLGLLFLGGGRYTLGTSDAAVACMVAAFFPRFSSVSSDNKCYLQALRHLWVLAVEPRCLIARDVDTKEGVYLPVKIKVKEGGDARTIQYIAPTLIPDLDKMMSIRIDTPRYWPFYMDMEAHPRHRAGLLRSQIVYVKRRTAFLSYSEDQKGSRSLLVRSGSSSALSAMLDFPQVSDVKIHPASDLNQFISSYSNDPLFLAFADYLCRGEGETPDEKLFNTYCHASLMDGILQDKPQTLQSHLTLYRYRTMRSDSQFFNLNIQDLRFIMDFYSKVFDRRFSCRSENNVRGPLIRENTVSGAAYIMDQRLEAFRGTRPFLTLLGRYSRGLAVEDAATSRILLQQLAWYLLRNSIPVSTVLVLLKGLAHQARLQCIDRDPPEGTRNVEALERGIKEVLHQTGMQMTSLLGGLWAIRSLDEIMDLWKEES